jgi:hypothetical protein
MIGLSNFMAVNLGEDGKILIIVRCNRIFRGLMSGIMA